MTHEHADVAVRGNELVGEVNRGAMPVLLFGIAIGLAVLVGESVASVLNGGQLKALFYLAAPPAYGAFGLLLSVIILVVARFAAHRRGTSTSDGPKPFTILTAISMTAIFVQGGVVVNELVLSSVSFLSPLSVSIDLIWGLLVVVLFGLAFVAGRSLPPRGSRVALVSGVALASFCISSLYLVVERPVAPGFTTALAQTLLVSLLAGLSIVAPLLACRVVCSKAPRITLARAVVPPAAAAVIGSVFHLSISTIPFDGFEELAPPSPVAADKPNVILIVVDTLRADHLSSYGYHRPTSPQLDALAADSTRFDRCISPSNWTPPGHASIFTGRFPISHGAHKFVSEGNPAYPTCFPLDRSEVTIAEILADEGYRTAAVVANFAFVSRALGLDQGFQFWFAAPPKRLKPLLLSFAFKFELLGQSSFLVDPVPYRRAAEIKNTCLWWIERFGDRPFFLFVNFMDPHYPYSPPSPWSGSFIDQPAPSPIPGFPGVVRNGLTIPTDSQRSLITSLYDSEIAYVDSEIGLFLSGLKRRGHYSDSIIVVTSDHGELLGEHGLFEHQIGLYEPVTRVPLIYKPARTTPKPLASRPVVQTVDIVPTILDALEIPVPGVVQGCSLLRSADHPVIAQHYADLHVADWYGGRFGADQTALIVADKKLVLSSDGTSELFDLSTDPEEQVDLAALDRATREQMSAIVAAWLRDVDQKTPALEEPPDIDGETARRLRSLGYAQ
jgi:arylsulfatase A-like enzyme